MLSYETREKLLPAIREVLPESDWDNIPSIFEKVYIMHYNNHITVYVMAYWGKDLPALCFSTNNYEFIGVCTQEYAIQNGLLI